MTVQPNSSYWIEQLAGEQPRRRRAPLLLYGILCFCLGLAAYLAGVLLVFPRYLLGLHEQLDAVAEWLVWYSGMPIVFGLGLAGIDLLVFLTREKPAVPVRFEPVRTRKVTVALTAYNDEDSIAGSVEDFL